MGRQSCLVAAARNWTPCGPTYVNEITGGWASESTKRRKPSKKRSPNLDAIPVERTRVEDREPWVRTPLGSHPMHAATPKPSGRTQTEGSALRGPERCCRSQLPGESRRQRRTLSSRLGTSVYADAAPRSCRGDRPRPVPSRWSHAGPRPTASDSAAAACAQRRSFDRDRTWSRPPARHALGGAPFPRRALDASSRPASRSVPVPS